MMSMPTKEEGMMMRKTAMHRMLGLSLMLAMTTLWALSHAQQQRPDVIYVPTPDHVVAEMLQIAAVMNNDVVYDLGSGDGRVVIAAAKHYGARGVGVDVDPERINDSRANAHKAGVVDRVQFLEQDLFATDIREATVVTLYLLPGLNLKLRPKLLSDLRPGTRVVSHAFAMEDWLPDKQLQVPGVSSPHTVYYWVVPADVAGVWRGSMSTPTGEQQYVLRLQQRFQKVEGTLSANGAEVPITNATLTGDQLSFATAPTAPGQQAKMSFDGQVSGNTMQGRMQVQAGPSAGQRHWTAYRDADGAIPTHHR